MAKSKQSGFKFRKHDNVGCESAELDEAYLRECYYEIGDLEILLNCQEPKCIVLGRTGSGKSALLLEVEEKVEHAVRIDPESLSLQYLSNSTILPRLESMGVSLGLFYKLLWRHIFAVELIKARFILKSESDTLNFLEKIWEYFIKDREKERAVEYLMDWVKEFWKDTRVSSQGSHQQAGIGCERHSCARSSPGSSRPRSAKARKSASRKKVKSSTAFRVSSIRYKYSN